MEEFVRKTLLEAANELEQTIGVLQHQVLNNLDAHANGGASKELDQYVKRPQMLQIARLKRLKVTIVKLASTGRLPNSQGESHAT